MTNEEILNAYKAAYKKAGDLSNTPITSPEGLSAAQNANNALTPTWTAPTAENLKQPHYDARKVQQNAAMGALNKNIRDGISPTVKDAYNPYAQPFNMSREAMVRRINMIKRQQAQDARLRKAAGLANEKIAPADKEINTIAERLGRIGYPRPR